MLQKLYKLVWSTCLDRKTRRRQEETEVLHVKKKKTRRNKSGAYLLLIVSFDDMQRAMPTFSSIALDRMLEPGARS